MNMQKENQNTSPTVHLLYGGLGAGKTTFAKQLERDLPALRLTHDEWMRHLYGEDPPLELFPIYNQRISELLDTLWPRCLELGVSVILDFGFWSRLERDAIRAKVAELGFCHKLYALECPEEVRWQRVEQRNQNQGPDSLYIARETFLSLGQRLEPLEGDEEYARVDTF
jgi:predicted kinase